VSLFARLTEDLSSEDQKLADDIVGASREVNSEMWQEVRARLWGHRGGIPGVKREGVVEAVPPSGAGCEKCRHAGRGQIAATTMRKGAWGRWSYLCQACADPISARMDDMQTQKKFARGAPLIHAESADFKPEWPATAEEGKAFVMLWADGRGIVAFRHKKDAQAFAAKKSNDVVWVHYEEPVRKKAGRLRVQNSYSPKQEAALDAVNLFARAAGEPRPTTLIEADKSDKQLLKKYPRAKAGDLPKDWKAILAPARKGVKAAREFETAIKKLNKSLPSPPGYAFGGHEAGTEEKWQQVFKAWAHSAADVIDKANSPLASLDAAAVKLYDMRTPRNVLAAAGHGSPASDLWMIFHRGVQSVIGISYGSNSTGPLEWAIERLGEGSKHLREIGDRVGGGEQKAYYKLNWYVVETTVMQRVHEIRRAVDFGIDWLHRAYPFFAKKVADTKRHRVELGRAGPMLLYAEFGQRQLEADGDELRKSYDFFRHACGLALKLYQQAGVGSKGLAGPVTLMWRDKTDGSAGRYSSSTNRLIVYADQIGLADGKVRDVGIADASWTLVHELAHRVYYKGLSANGRNFWNKMLWAMGKPLTRDMKLGIVTDVAKRRKDDRFKVMDTVPSSWGRDYSLKGDDATLVGSLSWWFQDQYAYQDYDYLVAWLEKKKHTDELPTNYANATPREAWPEAVTGTLLRRARSKRGRKPSEFLQAMVRRLFGQVRESEEDEELDVLDEEREADANDNTTCGVFLPVPHNIARLFPDKSEEDDSVPHYTLLFAGDLSAADYDKLVKVVRRVSRGYEPFTMTMKHYSEFVNNDGQTIPHMGATPNLGGLHSDLRMAAEAAGIPIAHTYGPEEAELPYAEQFKTHATLAYVDADELPYKGPRPEGSWRVTELEVWGWEKYRTLLGKTAIDQPTGERSMPANLDRTMEELELDASALTEADVLYGRAKGVKASFNAKRAALKIADAAASKSKLAKSHKLTAKQVAGLLAIYELRAVLRGFTQPGHKRKKIEVHDTFASSMQQRGLGTREFAGGPQDDKGTYTVFTLTPKGVAVVEQLAEIWADAYMNSLRLSEQDVGLTEATDFLPDSAKAWLDKNIVGIIKKRLKLDMKMSPGHPSYGSKTSYSAYLVPTGSTKLAYGNLYVLSVLNLGPRRWAVQLSPKGEPNYLLAVSKAGKTVADALKTLKLKIKAEKEGGYQGTLSKGDRIKGVFLGQEFTGRVSPLSGAHGLFIDFDTPLQGTGGASDMRDGALFDRHKRAGAYNYGSKKTGKWRTTILDKLSEESLFDRVIVGEQAPEGLKRRSLKSLRTRKK